MINQHYLGTNNMSPIMSRHDLTSSAAAKSHNKTEVWMYQRKNHQAKNISFLEIDRLLYVFQSSPKGFQTPKFESYSHNKFVTHPK